MALWALMDKYEGLPMDFCDASLVHLATRLKINRIATTDLRDFTVYRLPGNKRFIHVLEQTAQSCICYLINSFLPTYLLGYSSFLYIKAVPLRAPRSKTRKPPYSTRIAPCVCRAVSASFTLCRDKPTR